MATSVYIIKLKIFQIFLENPVVSNFCELGVRKEHQPVCVFIHTGVNIDHIAGGGKKKKLKRDQNNQSQKTHKKYFLKIIGGGYTPLSPEGGYKIDTQQSSGNLRGPGPQGQPPLKVHTWKKSIKI